jgi:hypothetical protein
MNETNQDKIDAARRYLKMAVQDGHNAVADIRSLLPHAELNPRAQVAIETSLRTVEGALNNIGNNLDEKHE